MELPVVKRLKKDLQDLMHELNVKLPKELQEAGGRTAISRRTPSTKRRSRDRSFVRARIRQLQGRIRELLDVHAVFDPTRRRRVRQPGHRRGQRRRRQDRIPHRLSEEVEAATGAISLSSPIRSARS